MPALNKETPLCPAVWLYFSTSCILEKQRFSLRIAIHSVVQHLLDSLPWHIPQHPCRIEQASEGFRTRVDEVSCLASVQPSQPGEQICSCTGRDEIDELPILAKAAAVRLGVLPPGRDHVAVEAFDMNQDFIFAIVDGSRFFPDLLASPQEWRLLEVFGGDGKIAPLE